MSVNYIAFNVASVHDEGFLSNIEIWDYRVLKRYDDTLLIRFADVLTREIIIWPKKGVILL